jgi:SAM-dependent methyltransferase
MKPYYNPKNMKLQRQIRAIIALMDKQFSKDKPRQYDIDSKIYLSGLLDDLDFVADYSRRSGLVLDIGSGKGHISALMTRYFFEVRSIDIHDSSGEGDIFNSKTLGSEWQKRLWRSLSDRYPVSYQFYDGKKIPFRNKSLDTIVAYAVIEHLEENGFSAAAFLAECNRVLKKNGRIFIFKCPQKYSCTENLARLLGLPHHDKLFSMAELKDLFTSSGFKVMHLEKTDFVPAFVPGVSVRTLNLFAPFMLSVQKILKLLRLDFFAHNWRLMATKK